MGQIQSFRDLDVYRQSVREAKRLFEITAAWPKDERYALTDQIRRSSRAVGALVAEAWGRRRYEAAFAEKLTQALAEANETQAWLDHAHLAGYLPEADYRALDEAWQHIGGKLHRMVQRADRFVQH